MKKTLLLFAALFAAVSFSANAETKKAVDGYGSVKWGSNMADARKNLKGKIVFDDDKKMIVTKDGEITYRYGFSFSEKKAENKPAPVPAQPAPAANTAPAAPAGAAPAPAQPRQPEAVPQQQAQDAPAEIETRLYYVILEFPYIALDKIKEKMTAEYGEPTGDTLTKNAQGALIWDSGRGVTIVWIDAYEKKPFCRRISYISKDIGKEIKDNLSKEFNKRELSVIKQLVP